MNKRYALTSFITFGNLLRTALKEKKSVDIPIAYILKCSYLSVISTYMNLKFITNQLILCILSDSL